MRRVTNCCSLFKVAAITTGYLTGAGVGSTAGSFLGAGTDTCFLVCIATSLGAGVCGVRFNTIGSMRMGLEKTSLPILQSILSRWRQGYNYQLQNPIHH